VRAIAASSGSRQNEGADSTSAEAAVHALAGIVTLVLADDANAKLKDGSGEDGTGSKAGLSLDDRRQLSASQPISDSGGDDGGELISQEV